MRIRSIQLKNFKKFGKKTLSFVDEETDIAKDLIVLMGSNGSGKSSILQAIAATLGPVTRRVAKPEELDWPGFDLQLVGNSWSLPSSVVLEVEFPEEECRAIRRCFDAVPGLHDVPGITQPASERIVCLTLAEGQVRAPTASQSFQFRGREYARQIVKLVEEGHNIFRQVGTVFWYTEYRTIVSFTPDEENGRKTPYDICLLRRRLTDLMVFHQRVERGEYKVRPGQRDLFEDLQRAYNTIFPRRSFEGAVPRTEAEDVFEEPLFYLYDQRRQYEIAEMSGGERAVFPILFEFAVQNIHNSVVLIDELELHLHPPMQQALIRALRKLGENNQFIITTHSDSVEQILPDDAIIRLED